MIITTSLIILMCIVFLAVFLFVRTIDTRKWLTILVSLVITPIIYFYMVYPIINIFSNYHHKRYFTTEFWRENPSLRFEISDELKNSQLLIGKTKNEVRQLLGPYEWLGWNDSLKIHNSSLWNYGLGIEPGAFNTKKECIEIVFKNDQVITVKPYKESIEFND